MNLLLDHLWQSTAVLAVIGLMTLCFRGNGAHVRHALWTAASLKFLVPFAVLNGWGLLAAQAMGLKLPPLAVVETLYAAGQPFSDGPIFRALPMPGQAATLWILALWLAGASVLVGFWLSRWLILRATLRVAVAVDVAAPMPVRISRTQMEPGLVGIFRPVLLLPEGILDRLNAAELKAVIAHEACHLRRRDNLLAALHLLAQAVFWFFPPVWWLGARLIAERERACDEAVLAAGNDPQAYATSILKVCKLYVQSPLACAAGIAGAELSKRMETIMENKMVVGLNGMKKALLGGAAAALVLMPLAAGLLWSPGAMAQGAACALAPIMQTHTLVPYPADAARAGETGTVGLRLTVAADGRVANAVVTQGSGFVRLDAAAISHVQQYYLWRPHRCGVVQTPLKVVFNLAAMPAQQPSNP